MRIARRRRYPLPPEHLWAHLEDPRRWAPLFLNPDAAPPRRVKMLDDAPRPRPGARIQVLRADHSWTIYAVERWEAARQVRLAAQSHGTGQEPGAAVPGTLVERLILIPQGGDTEAEWTIDRTGGLLSRLLLEKGRDPWGDALEGRLDALGALVGTPPGPED